MKSKMHICYVDVEELDQNHAWGFCLFEPFRHRLTYSVGFHVVTLNSLALSILSPPRPPVCISYSVKPLKNSYARLFASIEEYH